MALSHTRSLDPSRLGLAMVGRRGQAGVRTFVPCSGEEDAGRKRWFSDVSFSAGTEEADGGGR